MYGRKVNGFAISSKRVGQNKIYLLYFSKVFFIYLADNRKKSKISAHYQQGYCSYSVST